MPVPQDQPPVRQRLLRATSRLVYQHGIAATGVEAIAAAAGVAKMSLYRHFPGGKDELVAAALADRGDRTVRHLLAAARAGAAAAGEPGAVALVAALFDVVDAGAQRPGWRGCPFLNAAAELPAEHPGRAVVLAHKEQLLAHLTDLVREAGADPDQAESTARSLALLLDGALAASGLAPHRHPALLARSLALDLLARVLDPAPGADPGPPGR